VQKLNKFLESFLRFCFLFTYIFFLLKIYSIFSLLPTPVQRMKQLTLRGHGGVNFIYCYGPRKTGCFVARRRSLALWFGQVSGFLGWRLAGDLSGFI
jgi:hypothetical protein